MSQYDSFSSFSSPSLHVSPLTDHSVAPPLDDHGAVGVVLLHLVLLVPDHDHTVNLLKEGNEYEGAIYDICSRFLIGFLNMLKERKPFQQHFQSM